MVRSDDLADKELPETASAEAGDVCDGRPIRPINCAKKVLS